MEEAAPPPRPEGAPPPPTPPESPQLHEEDAVPRRRHSPAPSPAATPPEAKRAKAAARQDGGLRPGSWGEAGGGAADGEARPASRGAGRPAEQMEIGPLQRMAREPDVELFKGYHSYAVRTSSVSPTTDYEEEPFPEHHRPPSPESRGEPQRHGGTPVPPREPEEKPAPRAEAKAEQPRPKEAQPRPKEAQPRPKEVKQRPSPERRVAGRNEPADRKTEGRAPGRTEHKAGAKRSPAPLPPDAEECDEVMCGTFRGKAGHSGDSSSSVAFSVTGIALFFFPPAYSFPRIPKGPRDCGLRAAVLLLGAPFGILKLFGGNSPFLPLPPPFHPPGFCSRWALNVFWDMHFVWEGAGKGWSPAPGLTQPREFGVSPGAAQPPAQLPGASGTLQIP